MSDFGKSITTIADLNPSVSITGLPDNFLVSFIGMADVSEDGFLINKHERPLREVKSGFTRFNEGDVLFAKITPCMENGKGAIAKGLKNKIGFGSTEFHVFRNKQNGDAGFIYQILQSPGLRLEAEARMTGSAGQQRVPSEFFNFYKIFIPASLSEQRKLARILSTADAVIEKTQAAIAKYKAIKQGMLHDLFTRGIDPATNKLRPTYEDAPELYKKNKLGWIPKEWEVKQVKEVNDVFGGKRLPAGHNYSESNYGFKYLRVTDFYKKSILYSGLENLFPETFDILQRYEIQNDELFISIAGSIGFVGVLRHDLLDKVILTENALRIHPTQNIHPDFLAMQMNADVVQIQIWSEIGTGGGVPKLALHRVENLKILIPKNMEQLKIAERLLSIDNKIQTEQAYLHKMQQIKAGLMADLLSGKKKVNVNE